MRTRAYRRHQTERHMWRRLKEDWNEHYRRPNDLNQSRPTTQRELVCACFTDQRAMARFKEQPKQCGRSCCANPRHNGWNSSDSRLTVQERRAFQEPIDA